MDQFKIEVVEHPAGVVVVKPIGAAELLPNTVQLENRLNLLYAHHPRLLVLDLSALSMISSLGLSTLVAAKRTLERHGGKVVLADVHPEIAMVLQHSGLSAVFTRFEKVDEAIVAMGGHKA